MILQSTYSDFDFTNIWTIGNDPDYAYPELIVPEPATACTITFDLQGMGPTYSIEIGKDSKVPVQTDPAWTGYTFNGWFKEQACLTPWNFGTDTVVGDTTIWATG